MQLEGADVRPIEPESTALLFYSIKKSKLCSENPMQ